jgi:hypothetical protein
MKLDISLDDYVSAQVIESWNNNLSLLESLNPKPDTFSPPLPYNYDPEFPKKVIPLILDVAANKEEAYNAIGIVFCELFRKKESTANIEKKLDTSKTPGFFSKIFSGLTRHRRCTGSSVETTIPQCLYYLATDDALLYAKNTEALYQQLSRNMQTAMSIESTEKVVSKFYGAEIAHRARIALEGVPNAVRDSEISSRRGWRTQLRENVIRLLREQGIEKLEEICSETARIIKEGAYKERASDTDFDHHWSPGVLTRGGDFTCYKESNLNLAWEYLEDNNVIN